MNDESDTRPDDPADESTRGSSDPPDPSETGADGSGESAASDDPHRDAGTERGAGEDRRTRKDRMGDGIREGLGVLSAFRETLEESIREARDRGDLSADRAREVLKEAMDRAQHAAEGAKDRLDLVHQSELDVVLARLEAMEVRLKSLEAAVHGEDPPAS